MILKRRVSLNNVWLDEVDERITISDIECSDGRENISATDTAAGFGQRVTMNRRNTLDVVIKFRMFERGRSVNGLKERSKLLEKVNEWAAPGGILRTNYKTGRRLNVILVQAPGEGSLWDYTKEFQLTFRAYTIPYWEDNSANSESFGGKSASGSKTITVNGSAPTQFNVELENTSGQNIDTATVTVNGNTMTFSSLGLGGNETLVIDHKDGLVRIRIRNAQGTHRNAMSKRAGANDFTASPGDVACSFSGTKRACKMTVSWRSRYL